MISSIIKALFKKLKFISIGVSKKKNPQRIYDFLKAKTKPKFLFQLNTNQKNIVLQKKNFLRKSWQGGLNEKEDKAF